MKKKFHLLEPSTQEASLKLKTIFSFILLISSMKFLKLPIFQRKSVKSRNRFLLSSQKISKSSTKTSSLLMDLTTLSTTMSKPMMRKHLASSRLLFKIPLNLKSLKMKRSDLLMSLQIWQTETLSNTWDPRLSQTMETLLRLFLLLKRTTLSRSLDSPVKLNSSLSRVRSLPKQRRSMLKLLWAFGCRMSLSNSLSNWHSLRRYTNPINFYRSE